MPMPRPTSEALGFRHTHRPLQAGEHIPAMPSLMDQIAQINAMAHVAEADGDADNDNWSGQAVGVDEEDDNDSEAD
ncbi:MAG: hypothetical protein KBF58_13595 [Methyloversatilis sp.]|jgi:hypothetical protein|nr:hypothetical protein [Methyloversatilis sp.]MBP6195433.1 hypothetical protein [Methyloversatilis sp.]MBP9119094.1 hypothetical protein [Methyloversatilis sp.]